MYSLILAQKSTVYGNFFVLVPALTSTKRQKTQNLIFFKSSHGCRHTMWGGMIHLFARTSNDRIFIFGVTSNGFCNLNSTFILIICRNKVLYNPLESVYRAERWVAFLVLSFISTSWKLECFFIVSDSHKMILFFLGFE
ncbi:hypothetical protein BY458DRAFT_308457 [Sporodiniella umbellata]|nr:hypothetical protein BY458DRAFT_308457 [Sporodiniella umbellata]